MDVNRLYLKLIYIILKHYVYFLLAYEIDHISFLDCPVDHNQHVELSCYSVKIFVVDCIIPDCCCSFQLLFANKPYLFI